MRIANWLAGLGALLTLASLLGFLSPWGWPWDLASHFRVQYAGGLAILAVTLAALERRRWGAGLALAAAVNAAPVLAHALPEPIAAESRGPTVKALLLNVLVINDRHDEVAGLIRREDPDVVVLQEVNRRWVRGLESVRVRYPHRVEAGVEGRYGLVVWSRLPLAEAEPLTEEPGVRHAIHATLETGAGPLDLLAVHGPLPLTPGGHGERRRLFAEIGRRFGPERGPRVLIGDLNVTPWSSDFRDLLRTTGLSDSSIGRGWQPSWPTFLPPLALPIDHCLVAPEIEVRERRLGPVVGSDHRPLVVTLGLPVPPAASATVADPAGGTGAFSANAPAGALGVAPIGFGPGAGVASS